MIKIAITGNIASGKSQVEKILTDFNYPVVDTDKINNDIFLKDTDAQEEIKSAFSSYDICDINNNISKKKLANVVFNDKKEKKKLESILHPKIFERIEAFYKKHINEKMVFVSIPLLFETKREKYFDKIIFVSADEKTRLNRLMQRNNLTKEQAQLRIDAQEKEETKIKKSDFVIYNNSDLGSLKKQVKNILSILQS